MEENRTIIIVSVSIVNNGKVLIIKENRKNIINKWNFPSGHLENGEHPFITAKREVKEETGLDVYLTGTTGVYNFFSSKGDYIILFHFTGEICGGSLYFQEAGIVESKWVSIEELSNYENHKLREAPVIKHIVHNLLKNNIFSNKIYNEQLIKEE